MADKPLVFVHKAVEPKNLTERGMAALTELLMLFPEDATLWLKYDGVYVQFTRQFGEWRAFSRTGERLLSGETPERLKILEESGDPNRIYIGELFAAGLPHAEINGLARKKSPQPKLTVYLHDSASVILLTEHGVDPTTHLHRMMHAAKLTGGYSDRHFTMAKAVQIPHRELKARAFESTWAALVEQANMHKADKAAQGIALDGLILRDDGAAFTPGSGTNGGIYKVKPRQALDLRVIGEGVEQKATKLGGYLTVTYNGVPTDVGSGLTQDMLEMMRKGIARGWPVYKGSIAEVEFLGFTDDGHLREPTLKAIRFDKEKADGE